MYYESTLTHHGVKGQKWGVRRFQNKDGSLTSAGKKRAEEYREKELSRLDKKYDSSRLDKRIKKHIDQYNENPTDKKKNRLLSETAASLTLAGFHAAERAKLKNMTLEELNAERVEVGRIKTNNALRHVGGVTLATTLSGLVGVGVVHYKTENVSAAKTNMRVSEEEQKTVIDLAKSAAKQAVDITSSRAKTSVQTTRLSPEEEQEAWKALGEFYAKNSK